MVDILVVKCLHIPLFSFLSYIFKNEIAMPKESVLQLLLLLLLGIICHNDHHKLYMNLYLD